MNKINKTKKNVAYGAWTPIENTYYQFLTIELGDTRMIRKVATFGRSNTNEYVTEYIVQFSDDGELWRSYVARDGEVQVKLTKLVANMVVRSINQLVIIFVQSI